MKIQGLVRNAENLEWSNDASPEIAKYCKNTRWKTIFSSGDTATNKLVLGFCEILEGRYLGLHHHLEAEIYYILKGEGIVSINGNKTSERLPAIRVVVEIQCGYSRFYNY